MVDSRRRLCWPGRTAVFGLDHLADEYTSGYLGRNGAGAGMGKPHQPELWFDAEERKRKSPEFPSRVIHRNGFSPESNRGPRRRIAAVSCLFQWRAGCPVVDEHKCRAPGENK